MSQFNITISLSEKIFDKKEEIKIEYHQNKQEKVFYDNIEFNKDEIIISGIRTKKINVETFLLSTLSTVYKEVSKALIYAYLSKGQFKISDIRFVSDNKVHSIKENEISQVFAKDNVELNALIISEDFKEMFFANTVDSQTLVKTLMYLILSYNEKHYIFDNSWKAFNSIISSLNKTASDFENLKYIRKLLDDNKDKFKKSIEFSRKVDLEYLNVCKTNSMIKNNHPQLKPNKKSKEADTVIERMYKNYSDSLLCEYLESKLPCKKKVLEETGLYESTAKYLSDQKQKQISNPLDITRFLVLKYAYYLRNKNFHAEVMANNFLFKNDDSNELLRISKPIQYLVIDLINNYSSFK